MLADRLHLDARETGHTGRGDFERHPARNPVTLRVQGAGIKHPARAIDRYLIVSTVMNGSDFIASLILAI